MTATDKRELCCERVLGIKSYCVYMTLDQKSEFSTFHPLPSVLGHSRRCNKSRGQKHARPSPDLSGHVASLISRQ